MNSLFKINKSYYRRVVRCTYANGTAFLSHKIINDNEESKVLD